jgi:ATP-dependent Lhr-like helicase
VRYVLASNLGWNSLRPVQDGAIPPILDGATTVILAPTAGGKTEAAILPLFSRVLDERWTPTSILYVAPLRALLNDLGRRIGDIAGHLGLTAAVWHGDTSQGDRRRIIASPPDVLLTTPESLEVLLSLASDERRMILSSARAIVVDEAHAFYGVDRGTHLLALIERLAHFAAHDLQRIALSATIGNPADLLSWLGGSSRRPGELVRIAADADRKEIFDVAYRDGLAGVVAELSRFSSEKTIVFCRTRASVEEIAHALDAAGTNAWPHHSALSRANREDAERAFRETNAGALVATSTLELGIDIGDLDRVVQIDAPATVAALLQRLGRTGRRGAPPRMSFIPTNPEQLVLTLALLTLHRSRWVEPLIPPWRPFPILAQQALATVLQTGGIARSELVRTLAENAAFARISEREIRATVDHLLEGDILTALDGSLTFGIAGERRYGYRRFSDIASVFDSGNSVTVVDGDREVGTLDRWFVDEMIARNRSSFLLNGRAWNVRSWPEAGSILGVAPGAHAEAPLFTGGGLVLGFEVMQSVRVVLERSVDEAHLPVGTVLTEPTVAMLRAAREAVAEQKLERTSSPLARDGAYWSLATYAGIRANRLIADLIFRDADPPATVTNTAIRLRTPTIDLIRLRERFTVLAQAKPATIFEGVTQVPRVDVKFGELVPEAEMASFILERTYDLVGAEQVAARGIRTTDRDA